jgi:pectin methylesterase-like acyl-CoA thioesterase
MFLSQKYNASIAFIIVGLMLLLSHRTFAQNIFYQLSTATTINPAPVTIPPPGNYPYSAAAPVNGNVWNVVDRNTLLPMNTVVGSTVTYSVNNQASGGAVKDAANNTLSGVSLSITYYSAVTTSTRSEPETGTAGEATIQPGGITANVPWRSYWGSGNGFIFTFSGLPASTPFGLYVYGVNGATAGSVSGASVSLLPVNALGGNTTNAQTYPGAVANSAGAYGAIWTGTSPNYTLMPTNTWQVIYGKTDGSGNFAFEHNGGGNGAYLSGFQLAALSAPTLTGPTNQTVIAGNNAILTATAAGLPSPVFQWRSNSISISGATNATLLLNNVQYSQNGVIYSLVATNLIGALTNSMTLSVMVKPGITGLNNQAATTGSTVNISPTVSGLPVPACQWQHDDVNLADGATGNGSTISGSATSALTINTAQAADSGTYSLIASNSAGITTNSMNLTVSSGNVAPNITGPVNQTVIQGSNATFSASVSGLPVPTLQWMVNGTSLQGETNSSLTLTNIAYSQNGYSYSLVASNAAGSVTNGATLFVLVPPTISAQPANLIVTNTQSAAFSVTASGVPTPNYQWYFNGNQISGATSSNYLIATASPANIGNYNVTISNSVGVVTSSVASLTVNSTMGVTTTVPANGAVGVCYDTPLYVTFNATPKLRTAGKIKIYNATNSSTPVDTIDLSLCFTNDINYAVNIQSYTIGGTVLNVFPVIITGNVAAIYPHQSLLTSNQTYYVTIDDGVFTDNSGAYFAGITATDFWRFTTKVSGPLNATNLVVAADGSGDFATVQGAVNFVANGNTTPTFINVRNGTYTEILNINNRNKLDIRGQSRSGTMIGYPNNNSVNPGAPQRSSSIVNANDCTLETLTLTNMTPAGGGQAEAVDVEGTRAIFYNMDLDSHQDTFLIHSAGKLVCFQDSLIQGDVDFNWGYGTVYYTNCELSCLSSGGHVTQPRSPTTTNGFGFFNCRITKGFSSGNFDLGRTINTPSSTSEALFAKCLMDDAVTGYASDAGVDMSDYSCSNLMATSAKTLANSTPLTSSDPYVIAVQSAPTWLYGWQPQVAPNILIQPTNQSASGGQPVLLLVGATGIASTKYQWKLNNANIADATNATLMFASINVTNSGVYSVVVSNASGTVVSSNATITVANTAPNLTPVSDVITNAGVTLSITNIAIDIDVPPQTLTFTLLSGPINSTLDNFGVFGWRPPASESWTTNSVSIKVTDNGSPNLSATNDFKVIVNPASKPSLGAILYNGSLLSVTVSGGTVGPDYVIETSTNLSSWQTLLITNSPPPTFIFADTNNASFPMRFYRARLAP